MKDVIKKYNDRKYNLKNVAEEMDMPYSTLLRKLNINDDYSIDVFDIVPLIKATNDYSLIYLLNEQLNLISIPMIADDNNFNITGISEFTKETGEALIEISNAMIDNNMDRKEALKCSKELMDVAQCAWKLIKELDKIINPEQ